MREKLLGKRSYHVLRAYLDLRYVKSIIKMLNKCNTVQKS